MLISLRAGTRLIVGRRHFTLLVAIAMATSPVAALAAPENMAPPGLIVAQSDLCRVALVAASYDDPGADDGEFLELHVERFAPGRTSTGGECHPSDAGASSLDAASPFPDGADGAGPVLGDCGLGELELIDGASAGCETYRAIPLAQVPMPPDDYVVLCPAGSSTDARAHCDVTSAGRSALRAGWLQNGPNDGFRFVDTNGQIGLEVGYEGAPSCFSPAAVSLATESGGTATSDDVNVVCDGAFTLLSEEEAPLRESVRCPGRDASGVTGTAVVPDGGVMAAAKAAGGARGAADAAPWVPERAPAPARPGTASVYGPIYVDAGATSLRHSPPGMPPIACTVGRSQHSRSTLALVLAGVVSLTLRKRRRRPERAPLPALRESCAARCGSAPGRSPSR
jgi:hypothetical protein